MDRQELLEHARETYAVAPEYLWAKFPSFFVLRHRDNRKWFGAVLRVPRDRLGLPGTGEVDILDVKCGPLLMGSFRQKPGILPAYHMNKTHWVTVLLDGTAARQDVIDLLRVSFDLTGGT